MQTVICNSRGSHVECSNCGAAKPHYNNSCEPCPLIEDAECKPIYFPAYCRFGTGEIIKVLNLTDFIKVWNQKNFSVITAGQNEIIVANAFDDSAFEATEGEFNLEYSKAIGVLDTKRHAH